MARLSLRYKYGGCQTWVKKFLHYPMSLCKPKASQLLTIKSSSFPEELSIWVEKGVEHGLDAHLLQSMHHGKSSLIIKFPMPCSERNHICAVLVGIEHDILWRLWQHRLILGMDKACTLLFWATLGEPFNISSNVCLSLLLQSRCSYSLLLVRVGALPLTLFILYTGRWSFSYRLDSLPISCKIYDETVSSA